MTGIVRRRRSRVRTANWNPWAGGFGDESALDLRFAETLALGPLVTFTRASSGSYFDSAGVLQTASNDAARFDHDPTSPFAALGLLIEEARTNLSLQSEDLGTTWTLSNGTASTNTIAAPDGNTTADTFVEASDTNAVHRVRQSLSWTSGTAYTISVYALARERSEIRVGFSNTHFPDSSLSWFDLSAGTLGTLGAGADSATITTVGGGWYRCSVTSTADVTGSSLYDIILSNGSETISYNGDGASGLDLWGAQVEAGAFPTSYIATTTGTVARSADVAEVSDLSWFNESAGTLYAEFSVPFLGATRVAAAIHGGADTHGYRLFARNTNESEADVKVSATAQAVFTLGTVSANTRHKIVLAYAVNDFAGTLDGAAPGTDTSGSLPGSITTLSIGNQATNNVPLNGHISSIAYWPRRYSNGFLQSLTV